MKKKTLYWIGGFLAVGLIGNMLEENIPVKKTVVKDVKESIKKETVVKDASVTAHTICKIIVENKLYKAVDINFPWGNRKIFNKENQRYIVKDYVIFEYRGIKQKANWHCDIQFKGGNEMDINNWEILNFEIIES